MLLSPASIMGAQTGKDDTLADLRLVIRRDTHTHMHTRTHTHTHTHKCTHRFTNMDRAAWGRHPQNHTHTHTCLQVCYCVASALLAKMAAAPTAGARLASTHRVLEQHHTHACMTDPQSVWGYICARLHPLHPDIESCTHVHNVHTVRVWI